MKAALKQEREMTWMNKRSQPKEGNLSQNTILFRPYTRV
ncbi:hypothetical protein GAGA_2638 [Paraglaciecola agarilytica NO2]|uniref:Uncharacterized protein n=1 Tax=Paraglaciecola agarilytica NO2 TaxID=1125747 RepID=A0ABQ0I7Z6_9ALTE|nr:hypothetical protein GAGA_2638 [Paraglaciecola agarilytica NO2]